MAIVKNPALSLEASGNLGGLCYTRWRELQVVRSAWQGTVPNTTLQVTYQGYLTEVSKKWSSLLTTGQRRAWDERAESVKWVSRLATVYQPSGYQLYMKWNIMRRVIGLAVEADPPTLVPLNGPTQFLVVYGVWTDKIRCTMKGYTSAPLPYCIQYFRAGPYDNGGRRAIAPEYRLKQVQTDSSNEWRWFDFDVLPGKWYWYKAREVWEWGEVGNWWYCHGEKSTVTWPDSNYCVENS